MPDTDDLNDYEWMGPDDDTEYVPIIVPKRDFSDVEKYLDIIRWWDYRCGSAAQAIVVYSELVSAAIIPHKNSVRIVAKNSSSVESFNFKFEDFFSDKKLIDCVLAKRHEDELERRRLLVAARQRAAAKEQSEHERALRHLRNMINKYPDEADKLITEVKERKAKNDA